MGIVIFCWIFGLFWIYKGKKTNAKLLSYMGLGVFFAGFGYFVNCCDFLTILLTGKNIEYSYMWGVFTYMMIAPAMLLAFYVAAELLIPDKKWYIVSIVLVLCIIIVLFLFFDPSSFSFEYPERSGENLIDDNLAFYSPAGILFAILFLSLLILCGFGILIKAFQLQGILKKKYLLFSIGFIIWSIFGMLDSLIYIGIAVAAVFFRIVMIFGLWLWHLGLREEPEKKEKIKPKKKVKVEGDLFRITKRPDKITEEEVSISKEKKICLVCKGKVLGQNVFICPECETFYCKKCSDTLSTLENACWVCEAPFDESKPSKPFKKVEEEIQVETTEKPQKKPKTKK